MIIDICPQVAPATPINHFTMGNLLASQVMDEAAEQAAFFYETSLRYDSTFAGAWDRLSSIRCLQRYWDA